MRHHLHLSSLILLAAVTGCMSNPRPTGDMGSRSMTFKGGRKECFLGAKRGLERRGYDILAENENSLFIRGGSDIRTATLRGEYKGDRVKWTVSLSGDAQQLEYSKLSASITDAIDRIYRNKTK